MRAEHLGSGNLSKAAFMPSADHAYLLSTRREIEGEVTAQSAWRDARSEGMDNVGVWAVSMEEAVKQTVAVDDERQPGYPKGHVSIDFQACASKGERERMARKLREFAISRGCLFISPDATHAEAVI
jgi:hypothetical protein